jgi:hypothetical protein
VAATDRATFDEETFRFEITTASKEVRRGCQDSNIILIRLGRWRSFFKEIVLSPDLYKLDLVGVRR